MFGKLFVLLQYLLPKYLLTAVVFRIARIKAPAVKNFLITRFVGLYKVDISDAALRVPDDYADFNAFFTRQLAPDARTIAADPDVIVSPVDGKVSAAGKIEDQQLIQAKGLKYTLDELLVTDAEAARKYLAGTFATIYLAPYNYHCVHAPVTGRLSSLRYIPGDLFSVNQATVANLPRLFARNERLVCEFETDFGPVVLVFVGAMNVGSITTRWSGTIRPRHKGIVEQLPLPEDPADREFFKGELLGWFNMGSTVIVLFPANTTRGIELLRNEQVLQVGNAIASTA